MFFRYFFFIYTNNSLFVPLSHFQSFWLITRPLCRQKVCRFYLRSLQGPPRQTSVLPIHFPPQIPCLIWFLPTDTGGMNGLHPIVFVGFAATLVVWRGQTLLAVLYSYAPSFLGSRGIEVLAYPYLCSKNTFFII